MTVKNIISGFRITGLFPIDRNAIVLLGGTPKSLAQRTGPGLNITVGHRPFSEHVCEMTGRTWHLPVKMAGRKRANVSVECSQFKKNDRRQITIWKSAIQHSP